MQQRARMGFTLGSVSPLTTHAARASARLCNSGSVSQGGLIGNHTPGQGVSLEGESTRSNRKQLGERITPIDNAPEAFAQH
jgi:hypothetical protein